VGFLLETKPGCSTDRPGHCARSQCQRIRQIVLSGTHRLPSSASPHNKNSPLWPGSGEGLAFDNYSYTRPPRLSWGRGGCCEHALVIFSRKSQSPASLIRFLVSSTNDPQGVVYRGFTEGTTTGNLPVNLGCNSELRSDEHDVECLSTRVHSERPSGTRHM
jgi:hypothetical protein